MARYYGIQNMGNSCFLSVQNLLCHVLLSKKVNISQHKKISRMFIFFLYGRKNLVSCDKVIKSNDIGLIKKKVLKKYGNLRMEKIT